jgi:hypothetical protein
MRLRWTIALAFIALALLQVAVVVPLALRNLSRLLTTQQEARVDQMMVAVDAEAARLRDDVRAAMDELAQSQALEDVAKDAARVPPPPHVTTAAARRSCAHATSTCSRCSMTKAERCRQAICLRASENPMIRSSP